MAAVPGMTDIALENHVESIDLTNYIKELTDLTSLPSDSYQSLINSIKNDIIEDVSNKNNMMSLGDNLEISEGCMLAILFLFDIFNKDSRLVLSKEIVDGLDIQMPETYITYYNHLIDYLLNHDEFNYDKNDIAQYISSVIDRFSQFTLSHVLFQKGSTISALSIIKMYKRNPRLLELMQYSGEKENKTVSELNKIRTEHKKEGIDIIRSDKSDNNPYRDYINSGAGININQFAEVFFTIMYKPDSFGNVIPIPIYTSFAKGLQSIKQYYIDCIGARTALITSKIQVRKSGYFNRKLSSLTSDLKIALDQPADCGTKHYLHYQVSNKNKLKMINKRYYYDDEKKKLVKIDSKKCEYLIGKTIKLRSPEFCALDGDVICKTCYGDLWKINITEDYSMNSSNNSDIDSYFQEADAIEHEDSINSDEFIKNKIPHKEKMRSLGVGSIATLSLTEPYTQKLLSTKHLLQVIVDKINLPEDAKKFLTLRSNKISLKTGVTIIIKGDDLEEDETHELDKYSTKVIYAIYRKKEIPLKFNQKLILNNDLADNLIDKYYDKKNDEYVIKQSDTNDEYLFKFIINNKGIADPLVDIKNAIEYNRFIQSIDSDIHVLTNYILDKLIASHTQISSIHIECILRELMFLKHSKTRKVFTEDTAPSYMLYNITDAILHGKNPSKALLYQYVYRLIMTDSYDLFHKNGASVMDKFME